VNVADLASALLLLVALFFFTAGTVGLLRLPDLHSRLHALTKADNLGLGLIVLAAMLQASGWMTVFKLALVWLLVLAAGTNVCYLIASCARPEDAAGTSVGEDV
jgi:multicomponent Na+:H+ antiporter subunit G